VNEILARPDIIERVRAIQMEPVTPTRAEAAKFFAEESELWEGRQAGESAVAMTSLALNFPQESVTA
jgi:hypothetical protein